MSKLELKEEVQLNNSKKVTTADKIILNPELKFYPTYSVVC